MPAVRDHSLAAGRLVGDVRRGTAVELVERALAQDAGRRDARRLRQPLEQVEVGVAAPRHREVLVEAADLLQQLAGHEQAVALDDAVEPVALADEVPDLEEAVAVGRPVDRGEEPILRALVVPACWASPCCPGPTYHCWVATTAGS